MESLSKDQSSKEEIYHSLQPTLAKSKKIAKIHNTSKKENQKKAKKKNKKVMLYQAWGQYMKKKDAYSSY